MDRWTPQLEKISQCFREEFGQLSEAELNRKPEKGSWSIAQNLNHLMVLNRSYFPIVRKLKEGSYSLPWHGRFDFLTRFLGKGLLQAVQPERKRKMKTFPIWEPMKGPFSADMLEKFEQHQEELKQLIQDSQDLVGAGAVIASPANGIIVYKLSTAFDIIVSHEQRHLNQAREVLEQIKGASS